MFQYPSGHVYVMSMLPLTKSFTVSVCEAQKFRRFGATFFMVSAAACDLVGRQDVRVDRFAGVDEVADLDDRDLVGEQRHAALVLGVEQDVPRQLGRVDLVGAVGERREADVERHVVDQAVGVDARLADRLGNALVVGQQRRVERLDQTGRLVVGPVRDARMDQVVLHARGDLRQRLLVVLEEGELHRRVGVVRALDVALPHLGDLVAGPFEDLDLAGLGGRVELRRRRRSGCRRARAGRRRRRRARRRAAGVGRGVRAAARCEQGGDRDAARGREEPTAIEVGAVFHPYAPSVWATSDDPSPFPPAPAATDALPPIT